MSSKVAIFIRSIFQPIRIFCNDLSSQLICFVKVVDANEDPILNLMRIVGLVNWLPLQPTAHPGAVRNDNLPFQINIPYKKLKDRHHYATKLQHTNETS